jgi:hypothetical protein
MCHFSTFCEICYFSTFCEMCHFSIFLNNIGSWIEIIGIFWRLSKILWPSSQLFECLFSTFWEVYLILYISVHDTILLQFYCENHVNEWLVAPTCLPNVLESTTAAKTSSNLSFKQNKPLSLFISQSVVQSQKYQQDKHKRGVWSRKKLFWIYWWLCNCSGFPDAFFELLIQRLM